MINNIWKTRIASYFNGGANRKVGGIPYAAHRAQITPPPYFSFLFILFFMLESGLGMAPQG